MKCHSYDSKTEISISGCNISLALLTTSLTSNYSLGYKFKFNKNTKYEFFEYLIEMTPDSTFTVTFNKLNIYFQGSTKKCSKPDPKTQNITVIEVQLDSTDLIYPCGSDDTEETTPPEIYDDKQNIDTQRIGYWSIIIIVFLAAIISLLVISIMHRQKNAKRKLMLDKFGHKVMC
ncbi:hypothetical protein RF11_04387 [Thelohanellus kitauei]|uniref:Uncharacterized protein n=1 Tax=Thelohanellus kitauei TaxID=669202 RepID=A0A0C2IK29_THEKT|nr:hypothetical protein RF11_04387 [Thelohanellus kitauei]